MDLSRFNIYESDDSTIKMKTVNAETESKGLFPPADDFKYVDNMIDGERLANEILEEGSDVFLNTGDEQDIQLPDWFDETKFKRGQKYMKDNYFSIILSNLCGLILILAVPTIRNVLILTKQSSTPRNAYKRYLSTLFRLLEWFQGDITDPQSSSFKNIKTVRSLHENANQLMNSLGSGITQRDMALTQFAFIGFPLLSPRLLGLTYSEEGIEGLVHFWKVIGYLLGIQDRFNLCHDDIEVTRTACQVCMNRYYQPEVEKAEEGFIFMTKTMLRGMWLLSPWIDTEAFYTYFKVVVGVPCSLKLSNRYSQWMFDLQLIIGEKLNSWWGFILRSFLNFDLWVRLVIIKRCPILAYIAFWDESEN